MQNTDQLLTLLSRSFAGDQFAYGQLLEWLQKYAQSQLKSGLRSYTNFPTELKNDIIQEILLAFHQTHQTFDTSRPFLPWINSLIRYKTIDFIRRKEFRVSMRGVDLEIVKFSWIEEPKADPVETEETLKLLDQLPSRHAEILRLSKIEGHSNREIATELKITEANVKVIVFRALKALKRSLSESKK